MTPSPRLETRHYPEAARRRLGKLALDVRKALGFEKSMPGFAKYIGAGTRALWALERGEPTVGQRTLERLADAVDGWTLDTLRHVLEHPKDPLPAITVGNGAQAEQKPAVVDYQAVVDIAEGLPREIVIEFVRVGFRQLPKLLEDRGQQVHDEALIKLTRLAQLTGLNLVDLLQGNAS